MKYAVAMDSITMIHTKFYKDWFRHSKVDTGEYTDRQKT
jgi:hypothetical protein